MSNAQVSPAEGLVDSACYLVQVASGNGFSLELTELELEMIRRHRAAQAVDAARRTARRVTLDVASRYEAWLQSNDRGSSYTTFVDEFGYDEKDAGEMFRKVETVILAAG